MSERECGKCKHWHQWSPYREKQYWESNMFFKGKYPDDVGCHFGDCDQIKKGSTFTDSFAGEEYTYDGYSFDDEEYDEDLHCFEEA